MTSRFEELKARLPEIADVVNRFESDAQRERAFDLLVSALDTKDPTPNGSGGGTSKPTKKKAASTKQTGKSGSAKKKQAKSKSGSSPPSVVDVDLGTGKPPFADLVETKKPKTFVDRTMVAVYWLTHHPDHRKVTLDLVYSVYRRMGWKTPADPGNQLRQLASAHKFLDTSDSNDITLTVGGVNYVEHELPPGHTDK